MAKMELDMFDVQCPICLDVYIDPVILTCGHMYCKECIESSRKITKACPVCVSPIRRIKKRDDRVKQMEKIMATQYAICHVCGETTLLSRLREHRTACEEAAENANKKTRVCTKVIRCALKNACLLAYPLFDKMVERRLPWLFRRVLLLFWIWGVYDSLVSVVRPLWDYVAQ
ncbi:E3 ubiquitin-protein ligase RNF114-like [Centruroides vittatus]|uniref:E3 ubiquitin-protein ligase RNF114-like n=1 Tax=Centruroides vittatus TaxID=120091 RepID=UPI003510A90E